MLWTEYQKKESAALDEDELLQLDSNTKTNKRFTLSVLYEWILSRIKVQEFPVVTSAKTISGSVNELKSSVDSTKKGLESKADSKEVENQLSKKADLEMVKSDLSQKADSKAVENELSKKANGAGITFSINDSGGLRVTYDDGK